jgi:hypothetical protein
MNCTCARICQFAPKSGRDYVVIRGDLRVHGSFRNGKSAYAATDGHRPLIVAVGFPIDGDDRTGRQVRAAREVNR